MLYQVTGINHSAGVSQSLTLATRTTRRLSVSSSWVSAYSEIVMVAVGMKHVKQPAMLFVMELAVRSRMLGLGPMAAARGASSSTKLLVKVPEKGREARWGSTPTTSIWLGMTCLVTCKQSYAIAKRLRQSMDVLRMKEWRDGMVGGQAHPQQCV